MKKNPSSSSSGFTLLELLIVVSILAVLATVVVIVINPAQILTRARDSNRLSELASLNKALQIAQVQGISFFGSPNTVYVSIPDSSSACSNLGLPPLPSGWSYACVSSSTYKDADSTGWIPINFNSLPSGSPLSVLPVDPVNSTTNDYYYTYTADSSNWELTALLESSDRHDQAINDGDAFPGVYSLGTSKGLTPATRDMGLVGYWKMDETSWTNDCSSTTVIDSSGNGNNGKSCPASTGPTGGAIGQVGKAGSFDGSNDYVQVPFTSTFNKSSFSVGFWAMWTASSTNSYIFSAGDTNSADRYLQIGRRNTNFFSFAFYSDDYDNVFSPALNSWQDVFVTWDSSSKKQKVYLNGALIGSRTSTGLLQIISGAQGFKIGSYSGGSFHSGSIDDVRVYNRVLSDTEISAIYNATK